MSVLNSGSWAQRRENGKKAGREGVFGCENERGGERKEEEILAGISYV